MNKLNAITKNITTIAIIITSLYIGKTKNKYIENINTTTPAKNILGNTISHHSENSKNY